MTNEELEQKISDAFVKATPDVFDDIMRDINKDKEPQKPKKEKGSKRKIITILTSIAVAAAVVIAIVALSLSNATSVLAATVSLDVNPGLEIRVDKKHKVMSVNPTTDDAKEIIGTMDFKGTDLEVAVNALVGSMLSKGYLSDISNSILISVDSDDFNEAEQLQNSLLNEINAFLKNDNYNAAILSQTIGDNTELIELAQKYGITAGKAQLIQDVIDKTGRYTFEDLVALSINELNLLQKSSSDKLASVGTASDKAYIGDDKAKDIAIENAQVSADSVRDYESELEYEDGVMIYDIEFKSGDTEYDYDINAITGAIIKTEKDRTDGGGNNNNANNGNNNNNNNGNNNNSNNNNYNSGSGNSGQNNSSSGNSSNNQSDGQRQTQAPQPATQAPTQKATQAQTKPAAQSNTPIGEAKAKSIALNHAKVSGGQVREYDIERDGNKYEIEFKAGKYEYSYEIDAYSGKILDVDKEYDD